MSHVYMLLYFLAVVALLAAMIGISALLGERHREPATSVPYESGISPTGSAHVRFSPHFYLVALLFVIFDLELVFLFAWAVAARELGWSGYAAAAVFVAILLVGLVYEWREGVLDWGVAKARSPKGGAVS